MEVIEVIKQCSADGNILRLPQIELSREDYLAVKKAIEKNGGKWKGGKTFGFVFADRDAADVIDSMVNGVADIKKDYQFFATPSDVADLMVAKLEIQPYEKILEPSAGNGALINAVLRLHSNITIDCYELNPLNRKVLEKYTKMGLTKQDIPVEELKTVNTARSSEGNIDWTDKAKTKAAEKAQRDRYTGAYKPSADVLDALIGFGRKR